MKNDSATACNAPLIFNLFPRYFSTVDEWSGIIPHASRMGFNWIYVNPFHEVGYSGSLYAIKNYYRLNQFFLKSGADPSDWHPLRKFVAACKTAGCSVMMDLVINHTAFDSVLVKTNPGWYRRDNEGKLVCPRAIDPANAANVTIWGDLAEIDNSGSSDRKGLWDYWDKLVGYFQEMGITGFRCDAAYQVPADLWRFLIASAKKRYPRTVFLAETLGCRLEEIDSLKGTGFDYLYNSSKYWEFDQPWCIEQHGRNKNVAPSISFPESHDTTRLAADWPGTLDVQKSRYLFCALFSHGILMPMGYEYGAKVKMDVVHGAVSQLEEPQWDLSDWIKEINMLKNNIPVLFEEGSWNVLFPYDRDILFLEKRSDKGSRSIFLCINKNKQNGRSVSIDECPNEVKSCKKMIAPFTETKQKQMPNPFRLEPAEIVLFL
ncbi:MAG TPA: alpha-amylase [Fibrobacteres bacterium]|nr:alpha-amylase [Fibrobacterota bacterium]